MEKELEIEFKTIVKESEFNKFMEFFKVTSDDFTLLTNYYFDTLENSLLEKQTGLRVRLSRDAYTLTLKKREDLGAMEYNQEITKTQFETFMEDGIIPCQEIKDIVGEDVKYITSLETRRIKINYKNGILFLDYSKYGDNHDFEIEYEVTNKFEGLDEFKKLLKYFNVKYKASAFKIERAFAKIK